MKGLFLILFLLISTTQTEAQSLKKVLKAYQNVITESDALNLKSNYKKWDITVQSSSPVDFTFKGAPSSELISATPIGDVLNEKPCDNCFRFVIKVLSKSPTTAYRCSYIFLDGSKWDMSIIDKKRDEIINSYYEGTPFIELVKQYNMDGNPTGNFGWYREHMTVKPFFEAVAAHEKGELFKVDVPRQKWHYVVLKTHADTSVEMTSYVQVRLKK